MVADKKKKTEGSSIALLGLTSGPLPNVLNSSVVLPDFKAEPTTKMRSSKANS